MSVQEAAAEPLAQRVRLLQSLGLGMAVLNRIFLGAAAFCLLLLFLPYVTDPSHFGLLRWMSKLEWRFAHFISQILPTHWGGRDISHWLVIVALFALGRLCERVSTRCYDMLRYLRFKTDYDQWKKDKNLADNAQVLSPLNEILAQLRAGKLKDRDQLLKIFAETKRKLDEIGKDLAFLSIDVVDSTGIKVGEEQAAVEYDFKAYKNYVEGKLQAHGCLQTTWTPDGVMSCFSTVDAAVEAARAVIEELAEFNAHVKTMRRDFRVRCGINAGRVYFDPSRPLEEISDRVLDIAAHCQKNAAPDTIWITQSAVEALHHQMGFTPTGKAVQGSEAYQWAPVDTKIVPDPVAHGNIAFEPSGA
ncbi:MAG: hypothetical protein JO316_02860 [Abitibacteriaceae bacterium]|nr:hypothetical protein [Abditibacteriaceae bacterium]